MAIRIDIGRQVKNPVPVFKGRARNGAGDAVCIFQMLGFVENVESVESVEYLSVARLHRYGSGKTLGIALAAAKDV
ncbi:MAG: hypothetical protein WBO46_27500, partial [Caldilineaceae bacterium]